MSSLWGSLLLFAQEQPAEQPAPNPFITFAPLALIAVFYVFMILLPDQKRNKEKQKKLNALKKNDRVLTIGGIYGTVSNIRDNDVIVLKVDDDKDIKMEFSRSSIAQVIV